MTSCARKGLCVLLMEFGENTQSHDAGTNEYAEGESAPYDATTKKTRLTEYKPKGQSQFSKQWPEKGQCLQPC